MKLDRSTYEAWLLDRIEGRLTSAQERELDAFLAANPDLTVDPGELPTLYEAAHAITWKDELKKDLPPQGLPTVARLNDHLVARLEGDLTGEQEQALDRFLREHPRSSRDAALMAMSKVDAAFVAFDAKAHIQRNFPPLGLPDDHRLIDFLIADAEGDLTAVQRTALAAFVQGRAHAQREERLVKAARVGTERVVFGNKEQLKKREARVIPLWTRLAAAASIAVVAGAAWWLLKEQQVDTPNVAVKTEVAAPTLPSQSSATENQEVLPNSTEATEPDGRIRTEEQVSPSAPSTHKRKEAGTVPQEQVPVQPEPVPVPPVQLAQDEEPRPTPAEVPTVAQVENASPATANTQADEQAAQQGSSTIPALLANTVRDRVLDTPERNAGLDADDAVALVDKGLASLSGGAAGVEVQRTDRRERLHLRLGQGFVLTASRGR